MRRGISNKFNRGEIDTRALLRDDVEKVTNSCELMENFMPLRLGPMQFRPGTLHVGNITGPSYQLPFVARTDDAAIVSITASSVTVWVDDALVTKPLGTAVLANQEFDTNLTGWTDDSGVGSSTAWQTGGYAKLTGADTTRAKLYQTYTGSGVGTEHSVIITILEAPVIVKIGESGVDSDDIFSGTLDPGVHQLVFTPAVSLPTITLANDKRYRALVDSVVVGDGSTLTLPLPVNITELSSIRVAQSADVLFISTSNTPQFKIERRGTSSWGIATYKSDDGPFGLINNTNITLTAGDLNGNTTLTASEALFKSTDVGRLYRLSSTSQVVQADISSDDAGTDDIRVVGVGPVRKFKVRIQGTFNATTTLQRSVDGLSWQDVETYGSTVNKTYNDDLDNSILNYRLHVEPGDYTSGTVEMMLTYESGSIDGTCRVTSYTSSTVVDIQVLDSMGDTNKTRDWNVDEWGKDDDFPTAVALYESRLWWAGLNKLWGSVSDEYASFDDELEGDSATIRRTIGFGPVDRVDWLAPSSRLVMGVASDEISVRSSSFGVVLSQSNCNLKSGSTQGVAPVEPLKVDDQLLFVQRSGTKLMDAGYVVDNDSHMTTDLCTLTPDICDSGIVRVAASRQPETRVYVVLEDGSMRVHLRDPSEDVAAWSRITTASGLFKDVVVLPGEKEDVVYVTVERDGTLRLEKFSLMGDMITQHYDAAVIYPYPPITTLTGLDHLEGETVLAWGDDGLIVGPIFGGYLVSGGSITLASGGHTSVTVGLLYTADYKSNKVSNYMKGRVVGVPKRVVDLHLAMEDYWPFSITVGPSFDQLERMPEVENGKPVDATTMITEYDEKPFEFNGEDEVNPRICVRAGGPCVILALSYGVVTDDDTAGDEA